MSGPTGTSRRLAAADIPKIAPEVFGGCPNVTAHATLRRDLHRCARQTAPCQPGLTRCCP